MIRSFNGDGNVNGKGFGSTGEHGVGSVPKGPWFVTDRNRRSQVE